MAIDELDDVGIADIKNPKTVRKWNCSFRLKETFHVSFNRKQSIPKVFDFFPQALIDFKKFCDEKVKTGKLSTESTQVELKNIILPNSYDCYINNIDLNERDNVPSYVELLRSLDISNICYSTVYLWLKNLGYEYDENKRCYYTDGHEREDVILDREERFLGDYFNLEQRSYW